MMACSPQGRGDLRLLGSRTVCYRRALYRSPGARRVTQGATMLLRMLAGALAAASIAALGALGPANAQGYPSRSVTIVVPLAAGTGMDVLVRLYAEKLQERLGKPVVVENKPGAALMLAASTVAAAPPDGHTLLVSTSTVIAINPVLYKKVNYDPQKDFTPISFYVKSPFILVVNKDLPVKSVPELIKYAKEAKTPVTFASTGIGTGLHLAGEYMKQRFGLNMTHVPYRNTGQSLADIVAGHVHMSFAEAGASLPLIREGKLRVLAVSASTRVPTLPDVPTFAEAAEVPDFEVVSWHMLFAPGATPKDIVLRLHGDMNGIISNPEMRKRILGIGLLPVGTPTLEETQKFIASEREKWGSLLRKLGLQGTQ
jgi:tripartite-type tricarboxylate transporter receptor subunit TctC